MGKTQLKEKNLEDILNRKLSEVIENVDEILHRRSEDFRLIEKNVGELAKVLDQLSTYQQLQKEILSSPMILQLIEEWRYFIRKISPFAILRLLLGMGKEVSLEVDEFGKDEIFMEKMQPLINFLYEDYWRVEVEGVENLPQEGPFLLVANHAGVLPFDAFMITEAVKRNHPFGKFPRFLIEEWFLTQPFIGIILQRYGMARGSQDNALRLLQKGEIVGLFPEGRKGIFKTYPEKYKLQRFGRGGTVKVAIKGGTPVIPVAVVGSEEIYPVLSHWDFAARMAGLPFFPVTPFFPFLGLFGIIPLPAKWVIKFGEAIPLHELPLETIENEIIINTFNEELRSTIQEMIFEILKKRRSIFYG